MKHLTRIASRFVSFVLLTSALGAQAAPARASQPAVAPRAPAVAQALPGIVDFNSGIPAAFVGFADSWDGSGSATTLAMELGALAVPVLPPIASNQHVSVTYSIAASGSWGGGPGYGGVSHDFSPYQDWSNYDGLGFWFKGSNSGAAMRIELKTDGSGPGSSNRFEYSFVDNSSEWQYFILPFAGFVKRTDFNPGAGLGNSIVKSKMWGYSLLLPGGATGHFDMDEVELIGYATTYDFDSGTPAGFAGFADSWDGSGSATTLVSSLISGTLPVVPPATPNQFISVTYHIVSSGSWGGGPGYGGVSHDFSPYQDWSQYSAFSFWFKGSNSGAGMRVELKADGAGPGSSNRFEYSFTDDFSAWRYFILPFSSFVKRTDFNPGAGLGNSLVLSKMWGYSILLPGGSDGTFNMDRIAAARRAAQSSVTADFSAAAYSVGLGASAAISVELSAAPLATMTVDYATQNGSAIAGTDYLTAAGTLTFTLGITLQTFSVSAISSTVYRANKTVVLSLTAASGSVLGTRYNPSALTLVNSNPPPDIRLVDDYELGIAKRVDPLGAEIGFVTWGNVLGNVQLTATLATDGLIRPGQSDPNTLLTINYNIDQYGGFTHAFEQFGEWASQDWSRYDGVRFWLYGLNTGGVIQMDLFDNRGLGTSGDSAERWYYRVTDNFSGWRQISAPFPAFQRRTDFQPAGAPNDGLNLTDVSGYAFGWPAGMGARTAYLDQMELYGDLTRTAQQLRVSFSAYGYATGEGTPATVRLTLNDAAALPVTVTWAITDVTAHVGVDYAGPLSGQAVFAPGALVVTLTVDTYANSPVAPNRSAAMSLSAPVNAALGYRATAPLTIRDTSLPDPAMIDDFEAGIPPALSRNANMQVAPLQVLTGTANARPGQDAVNTVLSATYDIPNGQSGILTRAFATSRDWSAYNTLSFWFKGNGGGRPIKVNLLDNAQPDPGPGAWSLAWSDEFNGPAGSPPDPNNWGYDLGGGGWGNAEYEYYTNSRDNSALDGSGNLTITARPSSSSELQCWNGQCQYTSARLLSKNKQEFAYGRIEARLKLPFGQGIWPAFWMLGGNIDTVNWPNSGEIDIMEHVGKEPNNVYGTIHGPGYSGANGIGKVFTQTTPFSETFHTYAVEWQPNVIRWYVDGTLYQTRTPADLPPDAQWVFDHPFFIIMNLAVGGYWPGYPDGSTQFPQQMIVDYVRVYQPADSAERFQATFVDSSTEWRRVSVPFRSFQRSPSQPAGAPNDGLTLTQVWGYGFEVEGAIPSAFEPAGGNTTGSFLLDNVRGAVLREYIFPMIRR